MSRVRACSGLVMRTVLAVCLLVSIGVHSHQSARADSVVIEVDRFDDANAEIAQTCSAEPNDCSLRGAISKANLMSATDTRIVVPPGVYRLTLTGVNEDMNATGDLDIRRSMFLDGGGADATIIDASAGDRVVHVLNGADVSMDGVTLTGGMTNGHGAGLFNTTGSTARIIDSVVKDNHIRYPIGERTGSGGGLHNAGSMLVRRSSIVENSILSPDQIDNMGGGIYNHDNATITLEDCRVDRNTTEGLKNHGAGIRNRGSLSMTRCTVSKNSCTNCAGGGILGTEPGTMLIVQSAITDNYAGGIGSGAGVFSGYHSRMIMVNSTVSGNRTPVNGAGINGGSSGNHITLINNTISDNHAGGSGGGIYNDGGGIFILRNNIIYGSTASNGPECANQSLATTVESQGYNIFGAMTGCPFTASPTDSVDVDPLLAPLHNNPPGDRPSHAISRSSPALNAAPEASCVDDAGYPLVMDQRGIARPQGDACDIGAFELEMEPTAITDVDEPTPPGRYALQRFFPAIVK